jgi:hypothetical protein
VGDPVLLSGRGEVALGLRGLDLGERVGRHGAAVHTVDESLSLEHGEIAPDSLGGDAEDLGGLTHTDTSVSGHEICDGVLAFFGVQRGVTPVRRAIDRACQPDNGRDRDVAFFGFS